MRFPAFFLVLSLVACGGSVTSETTDASTSDSGASDTRVDSPTNVGFPTTCSMPGMCALVPRSCCGACGQPTKTDQIAIPRDKYGDYRTLACSGDGGPVSCPDCAAAPDPELQAFCRSGSCEPVFVPSDAISACTTDADCVLVSGVCCGLCDSERVLVAITKGKEGEFVNQICDPRVDCAPCPTPTPIKSKTHCDMATKHCVTDRVL